MVGVSLFSADAVVLVFSLADQESFEELVRLRELVRQAKGETKDQHQGIFYLSCGREPSEEYKHYCPGKGLSAYTVHCTLSVIYWVQLAFRVGHHSAHTELYTTGDRDSTF
jgi:hypothetical protein